MRLYAAICSVLEQWAERMKADTLETEFENADWAHSEADED